MYNSVVISTFEYSNYAAKILFHYKRNTCHLLVRCGVIYFYMFPVRAAILYASLLWGGIGNSIKLSFPPLQEHPTPITKDSTMACVVNFAYRRAIDSTGNPNAAK